MARFRAIFCQTYTLTEVWSKQDKLKSSIILQNSSHWSKHTLDSSITEQGLWARLTDLNQLVRDHGQWERAKEEGGIHTHQTSRCIPGRHGEAVPARPTRRGRGRTSPRCTGSTTSGASTGERTRGASTWAPSAAQQAPAARHRIRLLGVDRSRGGRSIRSPRRGGGQRFRLVELVEGAE
jgi:hypothetical protein